MGGSRMSSGVAATGAILVLVASAAHAQSRDTETTPWSSALQQLSSLALQQLSAPDDERDADPPSPSASTAALFQPGANVNGYVLVSRVRSLPSTFAPSAAVNAAAEEDVGFGVEPFGASAASWLVPELLFGALNESEASPLALPLPDAPDADNASDAAPPLGLPSPFEAELALASASSRFRLHRRVGKGSHGEVWRAVRADDPSGTPLVLKRLTLERGGSATLRSGLRERHFGRAFRRRSQRIARYIAHRHGSHSARVSH
jgi:hypothetical protein